MAADYQLIRYDEVPAQSFLKDTTKVDVRFYRDQLGMAGGGLTVMKLGPGVTSPPHTHKVQEEVFMVISGDVEAKVGDKVLTLHPYDGLRVPADTPRALRNVGSEPATIIVMGTPNTGPGDANMLPDFWSD